MKIGKSNTDGRALKDVALKAPGGAPLGPRAQAFSPFYFIGYRGENLAERFEFFRKNATSLANEGRVISREGDLVALELDTSDLINRYVVDLSKGGNLISYDASARKDGRPLGLEAYAWIYERNGEIWLPKEMSNQPSKYDISSHDSPNGQVVSSSMRSIRWLESRINEELPDSTFTLASIGVVDGDKIIDEASGTVFEYGLVEGSEQANSRWKTWLLAANIILLALIAIFLIPARMKGAK